MMPDLMVFVFGLFLGGVIGVLMTCLLVASQSRIDTQRETPRGNW